MNTTAFIAITWVKNFPDDRLSTMTGTDENGNVFLQDISHEHFFVTTPDGRMGWGMSPNYALQDAERPQTENHVHFCNILKARYSRRAINPNAEPRSRDDNKYDRD